jgi:ferredoxin-NADP reductase
MEKNKREFVLVDKKKEADEITSLFFKPLKGKEYKYIPGQYVNIKPPLTVNHVKSYTISSVPSEKLVCLTVKKKGETSSALIDLHIGDKLNFDGPYGNFYPDKASKDIVMLAGGIGITPFFSIIKSKLKTDFNGHIILFYSNKRNSRTPFLKDIIKLSKKHPNFKVIFCLTEEKTKQPSVKEYTRINKKILSKYLASIDNKCYYVCGSISFVNDIWKILKEIGVKEELIFTESFF